MAAAKPKFCETCKFYNRLDDIRGYCTVMPPEIYPEIAEGISEIDLLSLSHTDIIDRLSLQPITHCNRRACSEYVRSTAK